MEDIKKSQKINIKVDDDIAKGRYANLVMVGNSKEEFFLDFILLHGASGQANAVSRVIISPSHMKRMVEVIKGRIANYENDFGEIAESAGNNSSEIGFSGKI